MSVTIRMMACAVTLAATANLGPAQAPARLVRSHSAPGGRASLWH